MWLFGWFAECKNVITFALPTYLLFLSALKAVSIFRKPPVGWKRLEHEGTLTPLKYLNFYNEKKLKTQTLKQVFGT